jgi:hypothetical protein
LRLPSNASHSDSNVHQLGCVGHIGAVHDNDSQSRDGLCPKEAIDKRALCVTPVVDYHDLAGEVRSILQWRACVGRDGHRDGRLDRLGNA